MEKFKNYHAHIYFTPDQLERAESLVNKIKENFDLEIGRVWNKPVGPHPVGSCQITVPNEAFAQFIPWLMREREGLDIFLHPNSGDDLADHTRYAAWLGKSYALNIGMFEEK